MEHKIFYLNLPSLQDIWQYGYVQGSGWSSFPCCTQLFHSWHPDTRIYFIISPITPSRVVTRSGLDRGHTTSLIYLTSTVSMYGEWVRWNRFTVPCAQPYYCLCLTGVCVVCGRRVGRSPGPVSCQLRLRWAQSESLCCLCAIFVANFHSFQWNLMWEVIVVVNQLCEFYRWKSWIKKLNKCDIIVSSVCVIVALNTFQHP